jgi:hypothetical protein
MDEEDIDTAQKTNKKDIEVSEKKFLKEKFFELGMG